AYQGHDFPNILPLPTPTFERTFPVIAEETVHYALHGNGSDDEWSSLTPDGHNFVRLGEDQRLFVLTMFHEMHCLDVLHKAFRKDPLASPGHIHHCLNYLRQGALCSPDLSLEPGNFEEKDFSVERAGATHVCRDWEIVYEAMSKSMSRWMTKNSR
ncbi:hypothetical protein AN958_08983, partial [Leucoagaricus sp. SymC.cos]